MRTFIAVEIPEELRTSLVAVRAQLTDRLAEQNAASLLRWHDETKYHLTLRFLGDTTPAQRACVGNMLEKVAAGCAPFALTLTGLGAFPNWSKMRVLWVGVAGEVQLLERLQLAVEAGVQVCGFSVERQGFHPHATLAYANRDADSGWIAQTGALLAGQKKLAQYLGQWRVSELVLIRSDLRPEGSVYSELDRFSMTG